MQNAQAELQACEAHLALKEQELELRRASAIKEGLKIRCQALADCGRKWAQIGHQVLELHLGQQGKPNFLKQLDLQLIIVDCLRRCILPTAVCVPTCVICCRVFC
jgi:hypothetical protein